MLYVTFNDYPGGIYYSQVIDVLNYLNKYTSKKIKLVAFISIRNFIENRHLIKNKYSNSIVLPMFPGVKNWKWNRVWVMFLGLYFFHSSIICRGIFAFHLFFPFKKTGLFRKLIFDARGAYQAEFEEYGVIEDKSLVKKIAYLEKTAIMNADFKLAVSHSLVKYWKDAFLYSGENHVVIPCTVSKDFIKEFPDKKEIELIRQSMQIGADEIVIVFSGSAAGWQSLKYMDELFLQILDENKKVKLFFLGNHHWDDYEVFKKFPERVFQKKLENKEVLKFMYCADYGWLVREQSITNQVASPVKFAEYLSAGLRVIISENLGDYSEFCELHNCGIVFKNHSKIELTKVLYDEKLKLHPLAMIYFNKEHFKNEYKKLIDATR